MPVKPRGGFNVITVYKDGSSITTGPYHFLVAHIIVMTAIMAPHIKSIYVQLNRNR